MADRNVSEILFLLIRNTIVGTPVPMDLLQDTSVLPHLLKLAGKHSVSQLAANAIIENHLLSPETPEHALFYKKYLAAFSKITQTQYDQEQIMGVFEEEKIPFVLLKGAVLRVLYPAGWMRTSSDLDILVHEEDLDRAAQALVSRLHFRVHSHKNYHDICLVSPSGIPLELHFTILENTEHLDRVLQSVWEHLQPIPGFSYGYTEDTDFFYFHHLAHMAYHMMGGGCGIRSFLDLWIMTQKMPHTEMLHQFTQEANISVFASAAFQLANYWMEDTAADPLALQLGAFILDGGTFGTKDTRLAIQQEIHGSKGSFLLHRIFPPAKNLMILYPWLKKKRWLLPVAHILRWLSVLSPKKRQRIRQELAISHTVTREERDAVSDLLSDLKLI